MSKEIQKQEQKKTEDGLRGDFGRFLVDFGAFSGVPGGQKAGLKRDRFSGSEKSRILTKFPSEFESKKNTDLIRLNTLCGWDGSVANLKNHQKT